MKRSVVLLLLSLSLLLGLASEAQAQRGYHGRGNRGYYRSRPYYGPRYYHAAPYRPYGGRYYYRPRPYYGQPYYGRPYYGPRRGASVRIRL